MQREIKENKLSREKKGWKRGDYYNNIGMSGKPWLSMSGEIIPFSNTFHNRQARKRGPRILHPISFITTFITASRWATGWKLLLRDDGRLPALTGAAYRVTYCHQLWATTISGPPTCSTTPPTILTLHWHTHNPPHNPPQRGVYNSTTTTTGTVLPHIDIHHAFSPLVGFYLYYSSWWCYCGRNGFKLLRLVTRGAPRVKSAWY